MRLPLDGCRVLDLTRALSGPYCTMILADFGAEVVKVESIHGGDMSRSWGPFADGISVYYLSVNRNKKSVAINLRDPKGLEVVKHLAQRVDVVVENFRPGVAEKMSLGYDDVRASNPQVVYASISGFGRGGPYENWTGFDQVAQGMSGLMSVTGLPGQSLRVGLPIADLVTGMWTAIGTLAAIMQQRFTGVGQRVDTSLLASLVGMLCVQGQRYLSLGERVMPTGNAHPVLAPYGSFETANGLLNIAVGTEGMWRAFCGLLELTELVDHRDYCTNSARVANRDVLTEALERRLKTRTKEDWVIRLVDAGIPAGPINRIDEALEDLHVRAIGCIEEIVHPVIGPLRQLANPVRFNEQMGGSVRSAPPLLGEHTMDVLMEYGVDGSVIQALLDDKVIAAAESPSAIA